MQEYARGIGDHIRLEAFQIRVDRSKWNMNERNRVIKKSEKPIVSSDEADFIKALSILSHAKPVQHEG